MKSFSLVALLAYTIPAFGAIPGRRLAQREATNSELPAVEVKGNAFFAGNNRFYIRGIDYQPGGSSDLVDPLSDTTICSRDIPKFKELGINTVRIYTVDNSKDHSECMKMLADAGIYLVLDVNSPKYSLNRANPHQSYNAVYLQNVFATIDKFAGYTNVLAFFSGNEVINDDQTTAAARYVKAVTRDMRSYLAARNYRQIPVGYSAADVSSNRLEMAEYMNCGTDDERSDLFAFNDYSWCSPSDFETSGWNDKVKMFTDYGLPIFLSEYGCIEGTRDWSELEALYSTKMTGVYSGGLVYEYAMEDNGYGLVQITGDTANELKDFKKLKAKFASTKPPAGDGGYNSAHTASTCPPASATWNITTNLLPAIPDDAAQMMKNGAGPGVGLTGKGSQHADSTSKGDAKPGSGAVTSTSTGNEAASSSKSAAGLTMSKPFDIAPLFISALLAGFAGLGAFLL